MEAETRNFIENIDAWVKQIRTEFSEITDVSNVVEENVGNIQHNYELIHELNSQVESLKKEIGALKLLQLITLKERLHKKV